MLINVGADRWTPNDTTYVTYNGVNIQQQGQGVNTYKVELIEKSYIHSVHLTLLTTCTTNYLCA